MRIAISAYFTTPPSNGVASMLRAIASRDVRVGGTTSARVPIDVLNDDSRCLAFADQVYATATGWTGEINTIPFWSLSLQWRNASGADAFHDATRLFDRIVAIGSIDFAVAVAAAEEPDTETIDGYRAGILLDTPAVAYASDGPAGLGARTAFGPRVLDILDQETRDALEKVGNRLADGTITIGTTVADGPLPPELAHVATLLDRSGIALRIVSSSGGVQAEPGPNWIPLEEVPRASRPEEHAAAIIDQLQAAGVDNGGVPANDIEAADLVVPFSRLSSIGAENLSLEHSVLAYSDMSGSQLSDSAFVECDLRGIDARRATWTEVSLHGADLRWADFRDVRMPLARLDEANCEEIDLSGAQGLESAENTRFDRAIAANWSIPDAHLPGATFRNADLRGANLAGCNLQGAAFDGANLAGASLRGADLTNASFDGANLTDADMTDVQR
jgi:uncharacterized protein YjbI with pentapeptide repeats